MAAGWCNRRNIMDYKCTTARWHNDQMMHVSTTFIHKTMDVIIMQNPVRGDCGAPQYVQTRNMGRNRATPKCKTETPVVKLLGNMSRDANFKIPNCTRMKVFIITYMDRQM